MGPVKRLAAIDFDHTVTNLNTDLVARDLIDSSLISKEIKELYKRNGWIPYMQEIFKLLHKNGISKSELLTAVSDIPEVPGMVNCLQTLTKHNFDIIIISDSNSEFISSWNLKNGLSQYIDTIFTNPAKFNGDGLLEIKPYHSQTDCTLSSVNLCKGHILEEFLKNKNFEYKNVFYFGDGGNDVCPMLRLKEHDFGCPRKGYACEKEVEIIGNTPPHKLSAELCIWENGFDLLEGIQRIIQEIDED